MSEIQTNDFVEVTEFKITTKDGLTVLADKEQSIAILSSLTDNMPEKVTYENIADVETKVSAMRKARYLLQNIQKINTKTLNDLKNTDKTYWTELIGLIQPTESKYDLEAKDIRAEKKRAKDEEKRIEQERIQKMHDENSALKERILLAGLEAKTESDLLVFDTIRNDVEEFSARLDPELFYLSQILIADVDRYSAQAKEKVEANAEIERVRLANEKIIAAQKLASEKIIAYNKRLQEEKEKIEAEKKKLEDDKLEAERIEAKRIADIEQAKLDETKAIKDKEEAEIKAKADLEADIKAKAENDAKNLKILANDKEVAGYLREVLPIISEGIDVLVNSIPETENADASKLIDTFNADVAIAYDKVRSVLLK